MQRYLMRFSAACLHIENGTVAAGVAADVVTVTVAQKSSRQTLLHSHNSMHFCMCVHLCMCVCVCVWVHACKWQVEMHYSGLFRSAISQRAVVVAGGWVRAKVYVCVCVCTHTSMGVCARMHGHALGVVILPAPQPTTRHLHLHLHPLQRALCGFVCTWRLCSISLSLRPFV